MTEVEKLARTGNSIVKIIKRIVLFVVFVYVAYFVLIMAAAHNSGH